MEDFPPLFSICLRLEGLESSKDEKDDSNTEQQLLLNKKETSSENTPRIRREMKKSLKEKDDKQKEKSVENPSHLSSRPLQSTTEYADDKKPTVKLNEEQYTEPTLDNEKLPKDAIEEVSTQEAGSTDSTVST